MRLCAQAVLDCPDNTVMHAMAVKMDARGLYARTTPHICLREYRFRILRYIWRMQGSPCSHWSWWYKPLGFDHNFNKTAPAKTA